MVQTPWNYFDGVVGVWGACMLACMHASGFPGVVSGGVRASPRGWFSCAGARGAGGAGAAAGPAPWVLPAACALSCLGSGGRCVCLSWPLACPRCSWCFPRWWPACRGACMHACMRVSGGAPRGACGGRVRRCAGLGLWGAPWGAARPFLACSGAVLGRFWGVVWPGVPPRCRLEAGGGGCWGFCRGRVRVLRGRGARGRASRGP